MSIADRVIGTAEARAAHCAAKTELAAATHDAITNHDGEPTDQYSAANNRVAATEQQLPAWRRN